MYIQKIKAGPTINDIGTTDGSSDESLFYLSYILTSSTDGYDKIYYSMPGFTRFQSGYTPNIDKGYSRILSKLWIFRSALIGQVLQGLRCEIWSYLEVQSIKPVITRGYELWSSKVFEGG